MAAGKENLKRLYKYYGLDYYGFTYLPVKISGRWLTKLIHGPETPCELCFRIGFDLCSNRKRDIKRNWKKYRKLQYK